ncbi:hypothetical protein BKA80DRAFT_271681 [Phyllosticta citrichinensis]
MTYHPRCLHVRPGRSLPWSMLRPASLALTCCATRPVSDVSSFSHVLGLDTIVNLRPTATHALLRSDMSTLSNATHIPLLIHTLPSEHVLILLATPDSCPPTT